MRKLEFLNLIQFSILPTAAGILQAYTCSHLNNPLYLNIWFSYQEYHVTFAPQSPNSSFFQSDALLTIPTSLRIIWV